MSETSASDSRNSEIVTQQMDSGPVTEVINSSVQPSIVVDSSNVSSPPDDEDVQVMEAAYERMKAELVEQKKKFFAEEMAKLKVQVLLLETRGSREVARYFNSKSTPSDSWLPVNFLDQQPPPLLRRK
jgi:malate synthase